MRYVNDSAMRTFYCDNKKLGKGDFDKIFSAKIIFSSSKTLKILDISKM